MRSEYHDTVISYYHNITTPNGISRFWCQVKDFDTYWIVYAFSKEVSPKINELQAITFYEERANDVLALVAPPKRHLVEKKNDPKKILTLFQKNCSASKNCKSSESRVAKVSRQSKLCSVDKRPFEILTKNRK